MTLAAETVYACEGYRLPTEAEWEYAARGGTSTTWYCGNDESCLAWVAWWQVDTVHPVATRTANTFDLYDMSGNVWDWVVLYEEGEVIDPSGPPTGSMHSLRDGSWADMPTALRSAFRGVGTTNERNEYFGFRLVRSVED